MAGWKAGEIRDELRRARSGGRVHGAYLFEGPAGTARHETALWFARLLLCSSAGDDPCGECGDCRRSGAAEPAPDSRAEGDEQRPAPRHPDLHLVKPVPARPGERPRDSIVVDQIRDLQTRLALVANEGGHRVAVIAPAERLNAESANALLKTLEEPPPATTIVLVASSGDTLPPTVRSRATRFRFRREAEAEISAGLEREGLSTEDAALAASLGGGSLEAAHEWAEQHLDEAREMRDAIVDAERGTASAVLDFAEGFRGTGSARERCQLLLAVHGAVARERVAQAVQGDDRAAAERWLDRAEAGERARKELARRNLNPRLVAEGLLLALNGV
ncbi:MAG: DNA polymerase III subunit delta' [Deltaproteobacteria bacterium]|nr:DNA polymerase III subunit delta' [Deltaproteobacteria bacterium]MBW2415792.1 DNA polymerase III subunit delta' [Deltaproteobacteria bacterium]